LFVFWAPLEAEKCRLFLSPHFSLQGGLYAPIFFSLRQSFLGNAGRKRISAAIPGAGGTQLK
jgi:hypothetical protein